MHAAARYRDPIRDADRACQISIFITLTGT
jgi:hypothetical protein